MKKNPILFLLLISSVKTIGKFIQIFEAFSENLNFLYEHGFEIIELD